eukprot:TRINITY_DN3798_c0_g1_i2.p2 TRINITY_DN3798_c0_g1~~TRINITY_DN3798_c0_g1_i2.p2  ORF type:complete len:324 (-),score=85.02 TRINITY_DN3798_c0_g1_i2:55-1026(-)
MFGSELPLQVQLLAAQQMGMFAQQQQQHDLSFLAAQQQLLQQQHEQQQQLLQQHQQLQLQQLQAQQAQMKPKTGKSRSGSSASAAQKKLKNCPALSQEIIEAIAQELGEHGGRLPMGKLCGKFEGVKRGQLEGIFELSQIGEHGQVEVRLPGLEPVGVMMYGGEVVSQDMPLPPLEEDQIEQITTMVTSAPNGMAPLSRITHYVKGVKRQQIETLFDISTHRMGGKKRQYVRMKGTPVTDTEAMAKWKIVKAMRAAGGTDTGNLSTSAVEAANAQLLMEQHMMALGANPLLPGMAGQASFASASSGIGTKRKFSEALDTASFN